MISSGSVVREFNRRHSAGLIEFLPKTCLCITLESNRQPLSKPQGASLGRHIRVAILMDFSTNRPSLDENEPGEDDDEPGRCGDGQPLFEDYPAHQRSEHRSHVGNEIDLDWAKIVEQSEVDQIANCASYDRQIADCKNRFGGPDHLTRRLSRDHRSNVHYSGSAEHGPRLHRFDTDIRVDCPGENRPECERRRSEKDGYHRNCPPGKWIRRVWLRKDNHPCKSKQQPNHAWYRQSFVVECYPGESGRQQR